MIRILPPYWGFQELGAAARYMFFAGAAGGRQALLKNYLDKLLYPKRVILTDSGSGALVIILKSLRLEPGSTVLVPSFVCPRVIKAIEGAGYTPKYVDINDSLTMDTDDCAKKIDRATRVIIMPHVYGKVCDYRTIKEIAQEHNLILIDDAAAAFAPGYNGLRFGTEGDYGIFSFNYKVISAVMGGGIICDKDKEAYLRSYMEQHASGSNNGCRLVAAKHILQRVAYRIPSLTFTQRALKRVNPAANTADIVVRPRQIEPVSASIAFLQMQRIKPIMTRLNENTQYLEKHLKSNVSLSIVTSGFGDMHTRFVIRLNQEDSAVQAFRDYLGKKGIQTFSAYTPCHFLTESNVHLLKTERFSRQCIVIPNNPLYSLKDMAYVCNVINRYDYGA